MTQVKLGGNNHNHNPNPGAAVASTSDSISSLLFDACLSDWRREEASLGPFFLGWLVGTPVSIGPFFPESREGAVRVLTGFRTCWLASTRLSDSWIGETVGTSTPCLSGVLWVTARMGESYCSSLSTSESKEEKEKERANSYSINEITSSDVLIRGHLSWLYDAKWCSHKGKD